MTGRDEAYWAKPVRTLTVRTVPADAVNANVAGRRVAGAAQGFGQLWHKRFRVRLDGARVSPQEVIRVWKDRFGDFWPKGARVFLPAAGIAPGEIGLINAGVPGAPTFATGILVIYADDVSFSFISPEGHPFTGPITFSAFDDDGTTVAEVEEFTRASDPLWELLMILPFVGGILVSSVGRDARKSRGALGRRRRCRDADRLPRPAAAVVAGEERLAQRRHPFRHSRDRRATPMGLPPRRLKRGEDRRADLRFAHRLRPARRHLARAVASAPVPFVRLAADPSHAAAASAASRWACC